ncbi:Golgi-associated PDZ and coiled-coil motif-containing protein-like [Oppia nitens]|uniref:Golgi-associated PDZ and coiled-coil motif-containing protein-like n=1 Tax=Oppia nitens TaxID=1686743 RepID=UPI0023DA9A69|nr:Golgi-associated PDZ and coiled-coil motif-containing protein-like [Oppia nitens]
MASVSAIGLNWVHILEKEFDVSFVDTDTCLANAFAVVSDTEETVNGSQFNELLVNICDARQHLTALSGVFTQLIHKTITIANNNHNLEKELQELKQELYEAKAANNINLENIKPIENQQKDKYKSQSNLSNGLDYCQRNSFEILRTSDPLKDNETFKVKSKQLDIKTEECQQLRKENQSLRRQTLELQSELFGSRLAAKYLDKELAGRIQQIQLLSREARDAEHERLWNQLEAEIHLHRHKTVIRACRANTIDGCPLPLPPEHNNDVIKKRQGVGIYRYVTIDKESNEGIGLSITGGKEHGVPIIISQIHPDTPAARSGALYIGDAILSVNSIDLRQAKHMEAAHILSNQMGKCLLEVVFVSPDEPTDDDESVTGYADDEHRRDITGLGINAGNYPFFEPQVIDANDIQCNDCYNIHANNETESLDDSVSQVNETNVSVVSSPTKRYPGVAKLSSISRTNDIIISSNDKKTVNENLSQSNDSLATNQKKETFIQ